MFIPQNGLFQDFGTYLKTDLFCFLKSTLIYSMPMGPEYFELSACSDLGQHTNVYTYMYRIGKRRRLRGACASLQTSQIIRCSHTQCMNRANLLDF